MLLARRIGVIALVLFAAGRDAAACAGWEVTAEARMACCVSGACQMHQPDGHGSGAANLSQAEADSCCAASDRDDSTPSSPNFASIASLAILASPVPLVVLPTRSAFAVDFWRALAPLPGTQVSKHLFLSVFLI